MVSFEDWYKKEKANYIQTEMLSIQHEEGLSQRAALAKANEKWLRVFKTKIGSSNSTQQTNKAPTGLAGLVPSVDDATKQQVLGSRTVEKSGPMKYMWRNYTKGVGDALVGAEQAVRTEIADSLLHDGGQWVQEKQQIKADPLLQKSGVVDPATAELLEVSQLQDINDDWVQLANEKNRDAAEAIMENNKMAEWTHQDQKTAMIAADRSQQGAIMRGAGDVANAVGGMMPSLGASALGSPAAGMAVMAASAAGAKEQEVYDQTGDIRQASKAGLATAAKELATEKLVDGLSGLMGDSVTKDIVKRLSGDKGWAKYILNAAGEGLEEIIAELGQYIVDKGTWNDQAQLPAFKELMSVGATSAVVSLLLGWPVVFENGKAKVVETDEATAKEILNDYQKTGNDLLQQRIEELKAQTGSNIEKWSDKQLSRIENIARQQIESENDLNRVGERSALNKPLEDRLTDNFAQWRKDNFDGAFGKVSDEDMQALKELYEEDTGINLDFELKMSQKTDPYSVRAPHSDTSNITATEAAKGERSWKSKSDIPVDKGHTQQQRQTAAEFARAVDTRIVDFINKVKGLQNENYKKKIKMAVAQVTPRQIKEIQTLTNIDTTGFNHSLSGGALQHIEKRHGENGKADHSMATPEDIARIAYVLDNYDKVDILRDKKGQIKTSNEYKNADGSSAIMVQFVKRIDGHYYVVEAVPDSKAHEIAIVSAYQTKASGSADQVLNMPEGPQLTSEVLHGAYAPAGDSGTAPMVRGLQLPKAGSNATVIDNNIAGEQTNVKVPETPYLDAGYRLLDKMRAERLAGEQAAQTQKQAMGAAEAAVGNEVITDTQESAQNSRNLPEDTAISRVYSNTYENMKLFNDVERQMEGLREEDMSYNVKAEQASMQEAAERISRNAAGELEWLLQKDGWTGVDLDTAMGLLYRERAQARQSGDYGTVMELAQKIREQGTQGGQFVQAFAKYNRTAEGIAVKGVEQIERSSALSDTDKKRLTQKLFDWAGDMDTILFDDTATPEAKKAELIRVIKEQCAERNIKISERVINRLEASDVDILDQKARALLEAVTEDYTRPSSIWAKLRSWQTMAMLFNPATIGRNVVSNTAFGGLDKLANNIAIAPDKLISCFTGTRTVGLEKVRLKAGLEAAKKAATDIDLDVDTEQAGSKYGTHSRRTFKANSKNLPERLLSQKERLLSYGLVVPDEFAKGEARAATMDSLQKFVDNGTLTAEAAAAMAQEMALYRTFQDDSMPALLLKGLHDTANIAGFGKGANGMHEFGAGDLWVKFTQVPGNLIARSVEYSPAGYMKAIYNLAQMKTQLKAGDSTQAALAQRRAALAISRATTGTGLMTAFAVLAAKGILSNADDIEDDDQRALMNAQGVKDTQINLSALARLIKGEDTALRDGDQLLSIDFLEPIISTINVGIALNNEALADQNFSDRVGNLVFASVDGIWDAMEDLPMMQTMKAITNRIRYADADGIPPFFNVVLELCSAPISGFVPSLIRKTAQAFDPVYRDQYVRADQNAGGGREWADSTADSIKNMIPGLRSTLPAKITGLGEEKTSTNSRFTDFMNAYINPGQINRYQENSAEAELRRLFGLSGDASVYPDRNGDARISVDGQSYDLTGEEKRQFKITEGQSYSEMLTALLDSSDYKGMSTAEQLEVLSDAQAYARDQAQEEYLISRGKTYDAGTLTGTIDLLLENGSKVSTALLTASVLSNYDTTSSKKQYIYQSEILSAAEKSALLKNSNLTSQKALEQYDNYISRMRAFETLDYAAYQELYDMAWDNDLGDADAKRAAIKSKTGWSGEKVMVFWNAARGNKGYQ